MALQGIKAPPSGAGSDDVPLALPFDRRSLSYRISMEPILVAGSGGRALLLQVSHPSVAAGVAQHSDYQHRPWRRLIQTLRVMLRLEFGSDKASVAATRGLKKRHATVLGETDAGERYRALDPELLLWVWATLAETAARVYEFYVTPLSAEEREAYYQEQLLVAEACGVPRSFCPPNWEAFERYVEDVIANTLEPTTVAREVADSIRRPPLPAGIGRPAGSLGSFLTAGLLPDTLRHDLGFEWTEERAERFERFGKTTRRVASIVPAPIRRIPTLMSNLIVFGVWVRRRVRIVHP